MRVWGGIIIIIRIRGIIVGGISVGSNVIFIVFAIVQGVRISIIIIRSIGVIVVRGTNMCVCGTGHRSVEYVLIMRWRSSNLGH